MHILWSPAASSNLENDTLMSVLQKVGKTDAAVIDDNVNQLVHLGWEQALSMIT